MKVPRFGICLYILVTEPAPADLAGDPWCFKDARTENKSDIPGHVTEKLGELVTQKVSQVLGSVVLDPIILPDNIPADKLESMR